MRGLGLFIGGLFIGWILSDYYLVLRMNSVGANKPFGLFKADFTTNT